MTSGGIKLTVQSMARINSYEADGETLTPRGGGKFIEVRTNVLNDTKAALDLTCGFAVDAKLADVESRNFEPVEDLYKIPNNPTCNYDLQPGFDADMTWVYEVPETAEVSVFGFRDPDTANGFQTDYPFARVAAPAGL